MRLPLLALTVVLIAALTACVPAPSRFRPEITMAPVEAPLFASDAEALAAAEEVYREYVKVSEAIVAEGGADPDRIRNLSSPSWFKSQLETYESIRLSERRTSGPSTIEELKLQVWDGSQLVAYACHDFSAVQILDAAGNVVTTDRERFATFLVSLELDGQRFRVSDSQLWQSGDSCSS